MWRDNGCPKTGCVADIMRATRIKYHKSVKCVKHNEVIHATNRLADA